MSGVEIFEGDSKIRKHLLDIYTLPNNTLATRVSLLTAVQEKRTVHEKPYFQMVFKDCNSKKIVGRLFNPENYAETGTVFKQLRNKVVKVSFTIDEFGDSTYLNVKDMELAEDLQELKQAFTGRVEGIESITDEIKTKLQNESPEYLGTVVATVISNKLVERNSKEGLNEYEDRLGSKLKHMSKMIHGLSQLEVDSHDIAVYVLSELHVSKENTDEDGIENKSMKSLMILDKLLTGVIKHHEQSGTNLAEVKTYANQVLHMCQVRLGMCEPRTLLEYQVKEMDNTYRKLEHLAEVNKTLNTHVSKRTVHGTLYKERG